MLGANGIVGAGSPIAVGAGFTNKYLGNGAVSAAFFGDGSTNIGAFHEAANMACALRLPVVFVCENNEYGEFTPRDKTMAITDIVDRAAGYGIEGLVVDGMDILAVQEAADYAVQKARRGSGPTLLELKTYRYAGHSRGDPCGYRVSSSTEAARSVRPGWRQPRRVESPAARPHPRGAAALPCDLLDRYLQRRESQDASG